MNHLEPVMCGIHLPIFPKPVTDWISSQQRRSPRGFAKALSITAALSERSKHWRMLRSLASGLAKGWHVGLLILFVARSFPFGWSEARLVLRDPERYGVKSWVVGLV
jgi:hypothetical protein